MVEQHLWCIDTIMAQYAAFMQTEPVDPDDVYQSLAVRLIRAVNSYDPRKGYLKEYILSQLKREMVRIRSTQTVYGLTQAPANIGSTIVPLTIAAQRESYWETYIAVLFPCRMRRRMMRMDTENSRVRSSLAADWVYWWAFRCRKILSRFRRGMTFIRRSR